MRLYSAVCTTELITVKAPPGDVDLTIGGVAAVAAAAERTESVGVAGGHDGGTAMGKRYTDESGAIELLCTKPGDGVPALGGELLVLKDAKALPASD
jgi:hypothetical protein